MAYWALQRLQVLWLLLKSIFEPVDFILEHLALLLRLHEHAVDHCYLVLHVLILPSQVAGRLHGCDGSWLAWNHGWHINRCGALLDLALLGLGSCQIKSD